MGCIIFTRMEDILALKERIRNQITIGESDFREFKSAWEGKPGEKKPRKATDICKQIAEALVAFTNTDGGAILIGVEDDGTISGVPHTEEEVTTMLNAVHSHIMEGHTLPTLHRVSLELDGKVVLFFHVEKGKNKIFQLPDGRVMVRKGDASVPSTINAIEFPRQEQRSREYDNQFVDGATLHDLDLETIRELIDGLPIKLTPEKYLQQFDLASYDFGGLRLRQAALLLFAKDITRWHKHSEIRIVRVEGTELLSGHQYNVLSDESIPGNIYDLIHNAWDRLRPYLAAKTQFGQDHKFEQKFIYPLEACAEVILNAIVHRDYSRQNGIELYIFDDRMEIKSPGALLSSITIQDLVSLDNMHESRNSIIARVLKLHRLMREMGEGMKRIFNSVEENEQAPPSLYSNTNWFRVTLFNKSNYTKEQLQFLARFGKYNLSKLQKRILVAGMNGEELSPSQIYKAMNTQDRNTYDRVVTILRNAGLLLEIRSNVNARQAATNKGINKADVGRFKVNLIP